MSLGHNKHPASSGISLHEPKTAMYFGAAYVEHLFDFGGESQTEEYVVRSCNSGTNSSDQSSTDTYWQKYIQAKQQLQRLHWAMRGQDSETSDGPVMHVVQNGETLSIIAKVQQSHLQPVNYTFPVKKEEVLPIGMNN